MPKVAITGLGFMGRMHYRVFQEIPDAQLVAICDSDEKRLKDTTGKAGNVPGADKPLDLTGINLYTDFDEMLEKEQLDAVTIALPSYLHRDYTIKALDAGVNTFCEKPMAIDLEQCRQMIEAAEKNGKILQVGHCLRFWPEYEKTKQMLETGDYGKVKAATFQRLSLPPTWSWDNWLLDGKRSGGALLDLHIHDADYIQYVFGLPKAVSAHGVKGPSNHYDHVVASYIYDDPKVVTAEGGWVMTPSFGFEMSFNIICEKATFVYDCTRQPPFKVCLTKGEPVIPEVEKHDGYHREMIHFFKKIAGEDVPDIMTPQQSFDSIKLILAESKSIETGKEISLK